MIELMLAAPCSGSGKTAVTAALLAVLRRRGLAPCAFKCGPDYIDPMFHRAVLGLESHNLDLYLSSEETVRRLYARYSAGYGAAVTEGVMGFYDGVGGSTTRASAWHLADVLNLPVVLVVRPQGASLTLAAEIRGLASFRQNSHIVGVLLNDCSPALCKTLAGPLETETGVPVLGCLPRLEAANFPSRHLGLYTAQELTDWETRITALADALEANADIDRLISLCTRPARKPGCAVPQHRAVAKIAVVKDEAFCFAYAETLDALADAGAELCFFSPIHDRALPAGATGLYLPGGYPELYARELAANKSMLDAVRAAVTAGMPTVAECGGFLYLGQQLSSAQGEMFPMAGVLPGEGFAAGRLVRFGYAGLTAGEDSLLFRAGETVPVHEFHHWDSTAPGDAFAAQKPVSGRSWKCGYASPSLYAAFPHLYFAGAPHLTQRFVQAAADYAKTVYV